MIAFRFDPKWHVTKCTLIGHPLSTLHEQLVGFLALAQKRQYSKHAAFGHDQVIVATQPRSRMARVGWGCPVPFVCWNTKCWETVEAGNPYRAQSSEKYSENHANSNAENLSHGALKDGTGMRVPGFCSERRFQRHAARRANELLCRR